MNDKFGKILAVDTETGGLTSKHSLLTVYAAILDHDLNTVDELELNLKPDNGQFVVTEDALKINGINLSEHEKNAITYSEGRKQFLAFLENHSADGKLMAFGQNLGFDIQMLQEHLISPSVWFKNVEKSTLDTMSVAMLLTIEGIIPRGYSKSLGSMCELFGIRYINAHDAKVDVKLTVRLLQKMLKSLRKGQIVL